LATLTILAQEARVQDEAVSAARRFFTQAQHRYVGGAASYLEVTRAQAASLSSERVAIDIMRRRMGASARLIKALGGDWQDAKLAGTSTSQIVVDRP
jgi:outer membrane protein TolC